MTGFKKQKTVVIGAGPVGTLAALYAAHRGHNVEIYELRSDLRDPSITPLNFTKSINIALSERGLNGLRSSGSIDLAQRIMDETIPMVGRMIHGRKITGELYEQAQKYDPGDNAILAVDRGGLNKILLDELEEMPNVKFNFNHKLTGADFKKHKAWFEVSGSKSSKDSPFSRNQEVEIDFDLLIGADGAHSAARYHMMKFARMDYQQEYIDTLWCEFQIEAKDIAPGEPPENRFRISPNHLHIWPGKEFMFIAIPSFDGSFTCTLFLPSTHFSTLAADPTTLPTFFNTHFPGVTSLIPPSSLISSFTTNPHLPLISIKCHPYHYADSAVIVGDAAHAMVPFYGQGMNAGLEDVRLLFTILDRHIPTPSSHLSSAARAVALAEYSTFRKDDAYAINDLALQNYTEMRASVTSVGYKVRKWAEEGMSIWFPGLGWRTQYSRVSFGNERYSDVVRSTRRQGKLLMVWGVGVFGGLLMGSVGAGVVWGGRWWLGRGKR